MRTPGRRTTVQLVALASAYAFTLGALSLTHPQIPLPERARLALLAGAGLFAHGATPGAGGWIVCAAWLCPVPLHWLRPSDLAEALMGTFVVGWFALGVAP